MNENIQTLINETIEDLKLKIEKISQLAQSDDFQIQGELLKIRNKAINVLFTVSDKLYDACNSYEDDEDLNKTIEIVKKRSNDLYDDVISRIENLKVSEEVVVSEDIKEELDDYNPMQEDLSLQEEYVIVRDEKLEDILDSEILDEETINENDEVVNKVDETVNEKALDTLKGWLLPKGDEL